MQPNSRMVWALVLAFSALCILSLHLITINLQPSIRANAECLSGPGIWLDSSLSEDKFTDKIALELMYGSDSIAICSNEEQPSYYSFAIEEHPYFAYISTTLDSIHFEDRVIFGASIKDSLNEPSRYWVITEELCNMGCSCTACGPKLRSGVFVRVDGNWRVVSKPQLITEFGSYGIFHDLPENKKLAVVGPGKYGIILKDKHGNQGIVQTDMILIGEVDGKLQLILSTTTISEDGCYANDLPTCWRYDSNVDFVEGENPDYFDLRITTRGTVADMDHWGQVKDVSGTKVFEFKDGKYSLVNSN